MKIIKTQFSNTYFEFENGFHAVFHGKDKNVFHVVGPKGGTVKQDSPNWLKAQQAVLNYKTQEI